MEKEEKRVLHHDINYSYVSVSLPVQWNFLKRNTNVTKESAT